MIYYGYAIKGFRRIQDTGGFACSIYQDGKRIATVIQEREGNVFTYDFSLSDGDPTGGEQHKLFVERAQNMWIPRFQDPQDQQDATLLDLITVEKRRRQLRKGVTDSLWGFIVVEAPNYRNPGHADRIHMMRVPAFSYQQWKDDYDQAFDQKHGKQRWDIFLPVDE